MTRIGTCGNCGGTVVAGSEHLNAYCTSCGAVPLNGDTGVIPMRPVGEIIPLWPHQTSSKSPRSPGLTYIDDFGWDWSKD